MTCAGGRERLVRALEDPLCADVDPTSGSHLTEHRQTLGLEAPKLVPGRPARDEKRVGDQDPRRASMRPEDAYRLAALDEERLLLPELQKRPHDRAQSVMASCRLSGATVDDELLGALGDLRIEVVEEHAKRRLGRPGASIQLCAARCANV